MMPEQVTAILIFFAVLFVGNEALRHKFAKESESCVMSYFRTEAGNKIALRLPYNGSWVIAPRKFGEKGTMRYGVRADACWDEMYPQGLFKWLQVKIKCIDFIESISEPFVSKTLVPAAQAEDGSIEYLDRAEVQNGIYNTGDNRALVWVQPSPVVTPTLIGILKDEKSGDVAMRATAKIDELEQKLAKANNPRFMMILLLIAAAGAGASVYILYQYIMPVLPKIMDALQKIMAAAGI